MCYYFAQCFDAIFIAIIFAYTLLEEHIAQCLRSVVWVGLVRQRTLHADIMALRRHRWVICWHCKLTNTYATLRQPRRVYLMWHVAPAISISALTAVCTVGFALINHFLLLHSLLIPLPLFVDSNAKTIFSRVVNDILRNRKMLNNGLKGCRRNGGLYSVWHHEKRREVIKLMICLPLSLPSTQLKPGRNPGANYFPMLSFRLMPSTNRMRRKHYANIEWNGKNGFFGATICTDLPATCHKRATERTRATQWLTQRKLRIYLQSSDGAPPWCVPCWRWNPCRRVLRVCKTIFHV